MSSQPITTVSTYVYPGAAQFIEEVAKKAESQASSSSPSTASSSSRLYNDNPWTYTKMTLGHYVHPTGNQDDNNNNNPSTHKYQEDDLDDMDLAGSSEQGTSSKNNSDEYPFTQRASSSRPLSLLSHFTAGSISDRVHNASLSVFLRRAPSKGPDPK